MKAFKASLRPGLGREGLTATVTDFVKFTKCGICMEYFFSETITQPFKGTLMRI